MPQLRGNETILGLNTNGKAKEMDKEGHMMKIIERLERCLGSPR
jgi:hypothetical protein